MTIPPDELPSSHKQVGLPDQHDESKVSARVQKIRDMVNADMKAGLPPELHELYDKYYSRG